MLKIRRSRDRLIFDMGIPIPGKDGFYIETVPFWSEISPILLLLRSLAWVPQVAADLPAPGRFALTIPLWQDLPPEHLTRYWFQLESATELLERVCVDGNRKLFACRQVWYQKMGEILGISLKLNRPWICAWSVSKWKLIEIKSIAVKSMFLAFYFPRSFCHIFLQKLFPHLIGIERLQWHCWGNGVLYKINLHDNVSIPCNWENELWKYSSPLSSWFTSPLPPSPPPRPPLLQS